MKKMRVLLCIAAVAMLVSGCKPIYQQVIQGAWKLDTYYSNGEDDTAGFLLVYNDYTITFYDNKDFVEEYKGFGALPVTVTGEWIIERKPDGRIGEYQLRLTNDDTVRTYDIKKISRDTIDLYNDLGEGDNEELVLEPVPES